jgi:tetratricopeptide (TPR) repeat protein
MHLLLSRIALAKKDFPRAQNEAAEAAKDRGSRIAAEILLAQASAQQNALPQADEALQRAQSLNASEGGGPVEQLEFVRGDILARMERYPEAIAAFRKEIAEFPHNRQTYANLYLVLMVTNRPADAQQALEEMVKANPNRSAYLFAAHTVEALGDAQGAAAWKKRAK